MLHPSYTDLMKVVNSEVEEGETPVVNSRYSIVLATSKRARQIIGGEEPFVNGKGKKPLSIAIQELEQGLIKIMPEDDDSSDEMDAERAVLHADHYNEEMAAERAAEAEEEAEKEAAADGEE